MGRKDDAIGKLNILEDRHKAGTASAYDLALIYTSLDQKGRAFEWLQKAYVERSGGLLQLKADLMFDPIRSDPRFSDLIVRIGLPQ